MPVRASLEESDRGAIAFAFAYPGACGWGASERVAIDELLVDVGWTLEWLADHGLEAAVPEPAESVEIVERVEATGDPLQCDSEGWFAIDRQPVERQAVATTRRLLTASRLDLRDLVDDVASGDLDVRLVPDRRTVREILEHIAMAEHWYLTRVDWPVPVPASAGSYPDGTDALLEATRADVIAGLDALEETAPMVPDSRVADGERWSTRKVLRRLVWHELLHYKQLERLVPKVADAGR